MGKTRKVRSPRVLTFIHEYVWGEHAGNGKECVLLAGLSKNHPENARKYAYLLRRQKNVRELEAAEQAEKDSLLKSNSVAVAERTCRFALTEPDGEIVKTADVIRAQELFLKYAGKLNQKLELDNPTGEPITITFNLTPPKT